MPSSKQSTKLTEKASSSKTTGRISRHSREDRKQEFLDAAIKLYSEEGFDTGTRELAKRLSVTQPLLYRYFPSKDDLILEVYRAVYLRQWNNEWTSQLQDRSRPLPDRLSAFYADYTRAVFTREWMRIFFFAGLKGLDINKRYVQMVENRILAPICLEVRHTLGIESNTPLTADELNLVWSMHGGIFYQGIREHVYQLGAEVDHVQSVQNGIKMIMAVAPTTVRKAVKVSEQAR